MKIKYIACPLVDMVTRIVHGYTTLEIKRDPGLPGPLSRNISLFEDSFTELDPDDIDLSNPAVETRIQGLKPPLYMIAKEVQPSAACRDVTFYVASFYALKACLLKRLPSDFEHKVHIPNEYKQRISAILVRDDADAKVDVCKAKDVIDTQETDVLTMCLRTVPLDEYIKSFIIYHGVDTTYNPRMQATNGRIVKCILDTLHTDPGSFFAKNQGIRLASSKTNCSGPFHIYNGAHTTVALMRYTLEQLGCSSDTSSLTFAQLVSDLRSAYADGKLDDEGIMNKLSAVKISMSIVVPTNETVISSGQYAAAVRELAKSNNTSVSLSKRCLFAGAGYTETIMKYINTSKHILWQDNDPEQNGVSGSYILKLLAVLYSQLTVHGIKLGLKRFSPLTGGSIYQTDPAEMISKILSRPGVVDPATLTITNKAVASLTAMLPDLMKASDLLYVHFADLYNTAGTSPKRSKRVKALFGPGQKIKGFKTLHDTVELATSRMQRYHPLKTQFGIVPEAAEATYVTYGMIAPILYSFGILIDYNKEKDEFFWVVNPVTLILEEHELLAAALTPYMMDFVRSVITSNSSSWDNGICKSKNSHVATANAMRIVRAAFSQIN